jgi:2-methylcitrate dehydratase PrpD
LIGKGLFDEDSKDEEILRIKSFANKIKISCNDELDQLTPEKRPSKVIIKFNDGSSKEDTTFYPLGEAENPLMEEDILEKFSLLNPKFNMNKLQIIKHMEDYSISEIFEELGL